MADRGNFSEDSPILRPRIGGKRGEVRGSAVPRFHNALIAALERAGKRSQLATASTRQLRNLAAVRDVRAPGRTSRRCLIKARYVRMNRAGSDAARLHLKYIERDGVERDGSKGRLFGPAGNADRDAFLEPIANEPHQFRFIVSPEDADKLDLHEFTLRLMGQMEEDLNRKLRWAAVCHHDTDNPHVHVVLRGVDMAGKPVTIDPRYLSQGFRHRAQELATRELGPRFEWDIQRQVAKEVMQERCTGLDRTIEPLLDSQRSVDIETLHHAAPALKTYLVGRLAFLERLHLASRVSPSSWQLAAGWQEALTDLGQRGDIIKRMHVALKGPSDRCRLFGDDASGAPQGQGIEGIVRKKGLHNELGDELYAVVESPRGEAHYVRLAREHAELVQEGDLVRVSMQAERWLKESDRAIAAVAAKSGGRYDPERHRAEMAAAPPVIGGRVVPADEVVAANLRRLERLSRYRLVARLPDATWRIPGDLLQQLSERERKQSLARVTIDRLPMRIEEQIGHPGPTWLDTCSRDGLAARGLGAELSGALQLRAVFLRSQGLDPGDPGLMRRLTGLQPDRLAPNAPGLSR